MSGSFITGPPREAEQGGNEGDLIFQPESGSPNPDARGVSRYFQPIGS